MRDFIVTAHHMRLLRRAHVVWQEQGAGAPAIDPYRPYGSEDVLGDVATIIGEPPFVDAYGARHFNQVQAHRYQRLHRETALALALVLETAVVRGVWAAHDGAAPGYE